MGKEFAKKLVIVESPAKAETISKYLDGEYIVKASYGHVRDLPKTKIGIDVENEFAPQYLVSKNKQVSKALKDIKSIYNEKETQLYLATDEDREGEAIAWHLLEILAPDNSKSVKRIVFHEITKEAISDAFKSPATLNGNLVDAQQARRIIDRLVGYELSPILWKTVKSGLSAGRVQSVALRFIVDRERDIENFVQKSRFRITGEFNDNDNNTLVAECSKDFSTQEDVHTFLEKCKSAVFSVEKVAKSKVKKSPAPPFTTSTLQQEASHKLGFSVKKTMSIAQRLYETGKITYMRTDSVSLSNFALQEAEKTITSNYGKEYSHRTQFKTKAIRAQEAHEAIRPTDFNTKKAGTNQQEKKLYELIWRRAIASQMSPAIFDKTTISISLSNSGKKFVAKGEVLLFDGFLKVYKESKINGNGEEPVSLLAPIVEGSNLHYEELTATEKFTRPPFRYSEASLVRKLEEMGIGRPSTYAPTISTILERKYATLENVPGSKQTIRISILQNKKITDQTISEIKGKEKAKLIPTLIGTVVNDFLVKHFPEIVDYTFTARIEKEFDDIAMGKKLWNQMVKEFYSPFHKIVVSKKNSLTKADTLPSRDLGKDPDSGEPVSVRMGPYGLYAQLGDRNSKEKPKFARLLPDQKLETITLDQALDLFKLPRVLGKDEEGNEIIANIGRYGPYVKVKNSFASISPESPMEITLENAKILLKKKQDQQKNKVIKEFSDSSVKILNGRWGPYVTNGKKNTKIPKTAGEPADLTLDQCQELLDKPKRTRKKAK